MEKNEPDPKGAEQNKSVGGEWGAEENERPLGFRTSDTFDKATNTTKPDPSWWTKHWASGDDLNFGDRK